ncbi:hypothetical protein BMH32_07925 [Leucobacter sp. OLJS4]|nr:hypothetical protein BMH25_01025 [Leucobacter sp. OLCALW19]PII88985.1 hypothetical protein BMH27_15235 [Leucobacter sp. OLAS13]PII96074.1 hypothetical protein BMH26_01005 [Leucobacter sp. OLTLW20]PII99348.1 hypothetical protein BMH29_05450 [Leucobacter sp. OLDS2]PIJ01690.1 hypothetical protein BMH28_06020 [Leucobacter sp. OLCS4]PIJ04988.1 hypothetical protein BMH31_02465 [Leucobacter sp. OLIS6]PIJ11044.1 hypothetical protein BMH32_07925 [Leucobacter sp. OLJS4]PIJ57600.1 hypothetical prote
MLDRVDLVVSPTARVALVGDNGAGKSTLLGLLSGTVRPVAGEARVVLPGGLAHAAQDPRFPAGSTVAQAIDLLLADLRAVEAEIQHVSDRLAAVGPDEQSALLDRLGELIDRFEARDGHDVDLRVDAGLEQLGLGGLDRSRQVASLSGGERARLALATALASRAELLLLDEPTNDLDDQALAWLEGRLTAHRGALVVATHDRAFLDRFADDIVQVRDGGLRRSGDGYAGYLAARAAERRRQAELHEEWRTELARSEALVSANASRLAAIPRKLELDGFGHGAFRARSREHGAVSRIRMAKARVAALRASPVPPPPEPLRFDPGFAETADGIAASAPTGAEAQRPDTGALISLSGIRCTDGAALRMDAWTVRRGDRWLVTGPNGAGKTTLLRLLAGELGAQHGTIERHDALRTSWLRQEVASAPARSVVEHFGGAVGLHRVDAVDRLGRFGLLPEHAFERPVAALSVGQRRRLDLAIALAAPGDLILLDEPTNHLAPELVEQLEDALDAFDGAVVTVTHDRRWIERASGSSRVGVADGLATPAAE